MFNFLKRFLVAWKLARNPEALKILWTEVKSRETAQQIREAAGKKAKVAVTELVPADRHARRKDLDVTLQFECVEVMSPEEADKILEESRVENKPKLPEMGRVAYCQPLAQDVDAALEAHNDKFDRYSPQ